MTKRHKERYNERYLSAIQCPFSQAATAADDSAIVKGHSVYCNRDTGENRLVHPTPLPPPYPAHIFRSNSVVLHKRFLGLVISLTPL